MNKQENQYRSITKTHSFLKSKIESVDKNVDILRQASGAKWLSDGEYLQILKKLFLNLSRRIEPEALSLVPIDKNDEDECFFRHNYENVFNKVLSKKTPKKDQP